MTSLNSYLFIPLIGIAVFIVIPGVVYLCCKAGSYGIRVGKHKFEEDRRHGRFKNANDT